MGCEEVVRLYCNKGWAGIFPTSTAITTSFTSQSYMQFKVNLVPKDSLTCQAPCALFFRHNFVSQRYSCPYLKRLLEICWTSFYKVTKRVVENEEIIVDMLSKVSNDDNASVDLAKEASGVLSQLKQRHFFKVGKFLIHLLAILKPANAILQSQHVDLCSAAEVVQGCLGALRNLREHDSELQQYCTGMSTDELSPKRLRTMNPSYVDSVIFSTLGLEGQSGSECATEALRR